MAKRVLKSLERGWKNFLFGLIRLYLQVRRAEPVSDWTGGPRRVLFLRQDRLGDAIVSTGLLQAIAGVSPELELDVLGSPRNEALLRRLPFVRDVIVFDKRRPASFPALWRRLRGGRYDAVIDCMVTSRSMTGLLLMLATGAPIRMGIAGRGVDWGMTVSVPLTDGHIIDLLSPFIEAFGVDRRSVEWSPWLPLSDEERRWAEERWTSDGGPQGGRLLVNVSAGEPRRAWPDERYVAVIREIRRAHPELTVRVVGAPGERDRTAAIAAAAGAVAISTPSVEMVMAMVAAADFLFTPDTSLVHMASAFRTPTVALFIKDTSAQWGIYGSPGVNLESDGMTLDSLPATSAVAALKSVIEAGRSADLTA